METNGVSSPDMCESLDPRVQEELEKLNSTTDEINKLETQLDDANAAFRATLSESTQKLNLLAKKLGKCIEKARPYYDAKEVARTAQIETQKAAIQYQRSNSVHLAAKETITLAEERFLSKKQEWEFDNAWQEMLNHATMKVMEAEAMKRESEAEHQKRAALFTLAETKLQILERRLKKYVAKSRPYFEMKNVLHKNLEMLKERIEQLQITVMLAKRRYAESLHNLEAISEEIHERRKMCLLKFREPGVGAEIPAELPEIMLGIFVALVIPNISPFLYLILVCLQARDFSADWQISIFLEAVGIKKLDHVETASSTSELGSEVDFDDETASQITDDPETENLRKELSELSENMAAAAISVYHHTEAYLQKSPLSPDPSAFAWHLEPRASSCGSGTSQTDPSSGEQSPRENNITKDEVNSSKPKPNPVEVEEDAESFVSVDLND
ncbi:SH3 domain-binding protein 5 [Nymphon striatum]|nr:SH3 domain-binding protein 5 [Nymphon striatum]